MIIKIEIKIKAEIKNPSNFIQCTFILEVKSLMGRFSVIYYTQEMFFPFYIKRQNLYNENPYL